MTENIATLEWCPKCKGAGEILGPGVITLGADGSGGFAPGGVVVCPRCKGARVFVVGGCECGDEHETPWHDEPGSTKVRP
jgi:hypothetical protein